MRKASVNNTSARQELLVVLPILPWPPRRNGISLRFAPIIEHLSNHNVVDLVILGEDSLPISLPTAFASCRDISFLHGEKLRLPEWFRRWRTVAIGLSPFNSPFGSIRHMDWTSAYRFLAERVSFRRYDAALWVSADYELAIAVGKKAPHTRLVYDFVDSPTLTAQRNAPSQQVLRLLQPYTTWKWRRMERRLRAEFDASIYISKPDADAAGPQALSADLYIVPNGVYVDDATELQPRTHDGTQVIGFLGNMAYAPNVEAVRRLASSIFPKIRLHHPAARLLIIGRDPVPSVIALHCDAVTVTGTVPNIWAHISGVDVFVFPMMSGAGLQNKILEAMYAGIAVVTTSLAWESVGTAAPGRDMIVADTDEDIARHVVTLLSDSSVREALGRSGKAFVEREFVWSSILQQYESAVLGRPAK